MSADERWRGGEGSRQVEDRFSSGDGGFAAGSEGAGSDVWDREPATGAWREEWARFGTREDARRRVEQHPEVMPPHPMPVDRHDFKPEAHEGLALARQALPVVGLFFAGMALSRLFNRRRAKPAATAAPDLVLALRARGTRNRKATRKLAESLRGRAIKGALVFS